MIDIVRYVIPVALIYHWLLLHWPSGAGPGVGVLGILIAIVAHRRAARAYRDLAMVRYDALSEMSGQLSFSVALLNALGDGVVLSSINGRTETRTYAKIVRSGARRLGRKRAPHPRGLASCGVMRVSEPYWRA